MDVFNRLLGTTQINLREWAWALVPALALLLLWELGKLIARQSAAAQPQPSGAQLAEMPAQGNPVH
jgi:P-type Ca2+ transporter type 2C